MITTLTDVSVIIVRIIVMAILFGPHIARSIPLINKTCKTITRKFKFSYEIVYRNYKVLTKWKSDHSLISISFISVYVIISIFEFMYLLNIHILTFSLLRIPLLLHKEIIIAL